MRLPTIAAVACNCAEIPAKARAVGDQCAACRVLDLARDLLEIAFRFEGSSGLSYGTDRDTAEALESLRTAYSDLADEIHDAPAESPRSAGDGSAEPFCACGRRWSECDGSRAGCGRT